MEVNNENLQDEKLLDLRTNIIKWYDFKSDSKALVVGDETGVITRFLANKVREVMAVVEDEQSYQNLAVEAMLLKNITVQKNNFLNVKTETKFQYIILLSSLHFEKEDVENVAILEYAKNLLQEDGIILLALNNCVSLSFLSELDKHSTNIEGLTKFRLEKTLQEATLNDYKFYYPLPDYKVANVIFSDDLMPSGSQLARNIDLKQKVKEKNFNDQKILTEIVENSKYDFKYYCNSFFVEIHTNPFKNDIKAIYFNNIRKEQYQLITKISEDNAIKCNMSEKNKAHLQKISKNIEILNKLKINTLDTFDGKKVISQYVKNEVTLQDIFLSNFKQNRLLEIEKIVERYKNELLLKLEVVGNQNNVFKKYGVKISEEKLNRLTFVKHGLWDLTFQNIFIINNEFYVYDQEWYEENVPIEFILYRSIKYLTDISNEDKNRIYEHLKIDDFIEEFLQLENKIQKDIIDEELFLKYSNSLMSYEIDEKANYQIQVEEKNREIEKLESEKSQLIELYEKELIFKQGIIDSKEMMNSYINKELNDFSTAYFVVNKEIAKLHKELELKSQEVINICTSQQYIQGAIALKRREQLYPIIATWRYVKKITSQIFRPIKKGILSVIRKLGKKVYEVYPIKAHKRLLKNKFLYSDKLSKIGNVTQYKDYCKEPIDVMLMEDGTEKACVKYQVGLNKSIGIHLHLYYEDLLDEFYEYFCNIPYTFDLYVSVMKGADVKKIYNKLNSIINLNKLKVVETPNSGRDFGAMFVEFREDLKKHDYVMHVHSKKSLRMGEEQSAWRRYMLDNLLGSTSRIMKCFYLLEQMNMGMVYVDNFEKGCPYWANTWLNEAPIARKILNQIGIEFHDEILQFPAGSMFWAKTDALKQLFDLNLTWDDFGYEEGKNDGTLAYVFERITAIVARHNQYNIAIYNVEEKRFRENIGEQLFKTYYQFNKDALLNILANPFDIITFDIFDTLITRKIYKPDDSFEIVANKIKAKGIIIENYFELRKQAEENVRKNKNFEGDCNIHEIYDEFGKITGLSKDEVNFIKETEINTELDLVIPRYDMLEIYNKLLQNNKKIILISDMYLTKDIISKMLNKCGYYNWFDMLISSEVGYRKDNGTMWDYFFEQYKNCVTMHIGDNARSDIHAVLTREKEAFCVLNGSTLNSLMKFKYVNKGENLNLLESVMLGSIINRTVCNSPFAMNGIDNRSLINNYYDFGYAVLGPIIFNYILWLIKMAKEEKNGEVLLFAAREGYYLQKIYNIFKEKLDDFPNIEDHYLYISRRAVTVMQIKSVEDVREIMQTAFYGSLREVLYYRLNYKEDNFKDEIIILPRDIDKVMKIVEENFDIILKNAEKERETYLKYIDSLNIDFDNKKVSMLDLGYAGTAQYYLSKLLNKKLDGKYFVVQSKLKPIKLGEKVYSYYNKNIFSKDIDKNIIYKNSLFLEAFLTSPDGQFLYMDIKDDKFIPNFLHEPNKVDQIKKLDVVYEGVKDFTETMLTLMGNSIFDYEIDKKYIFRCYENCLNEAYKFNANMKNLFLVEDYYCSNAVLNTFNVLKREDKDWNYE